MTATAAIHAVHPLAVEDDWPDDLGQTPLHRAVELLERQFAVIDALRIENAELRARGDQLLLLQSPAVATQVAQPEADADWPPEPPPVASPRLAKGTGPRGQIARPKDPEERIEQLARLWRSAPATYEEIALLTGMRVKTLVAYKCSRMKHFSWVTTRRGMTVRHQIVAAQPSDGA